MTTLVDDILAHHGVKGMKWGVRKDGTPHTARSAKKEAKADAKWHKSIYSAKGAVAVHNNVADKMNNGELDKLNNNPKYKGKDLYSNKKLEKEYFKDYEKLCDKVYAQAVREVHGSSPSGKKTARYVNSVIDGPKIVVENASVKHAEDSDPDLVIRLKLDSKGLVIEANEAEEGVVHSDNVDDILAHYGVKGQKWGVRKPEGSHHATPVTANPRPGKKRIKTSGGKGHAPSHDAIDTAIIKRKARASSTSSLSNQELQSAIKRMQLEQQFSNLRTQSSRVGRGKLVVKELLGLGKTANEAISFSNSEAGQQIKSKLQKTA